MRSRYSDVICRLAAPSFVFSLSAWARIEGTLLLDGKPGERLPIRFWEYGNQGESFKDHGRNPPRYTAYVKTDDSGKFVIERVAPLGECKVEYYDYLRPDEGGMPGVALLTKAIRLEPGKTTTVSLGEEGVSVFGKFAIPEGWKSINWKGAKVALRPDLGPEPEFPQPKIPEEILKKYTIEEPDGEGKMWRVLKENLTEEQKKEIEDIVENYQPPPEEEEARKRYYQYVYEKQQLSSQPKNDGMVGEDGAFRVCSVSPGKYVLRIELIVPGADKKEESRTYFHSETVPLAVENVPINLKEIVPAFEEIPERKWDHAYSFE